MSDMSSSLFVSVCWSLISYFCDFFSSVLAVLGIYLPLGKRLDLGVGWDSVDRKMSVRSW